MPKRQITFHIGLEKTGTTSFQRFCADHRQHALRRGVLYPTRCLAYARAGANHAPLVAAYLKEGGPIDLNMSRSWRDVKETRKSLLEEIERSGAERVLISAEHFSSRFGASHIERLARDFDEFDCCIYIVLRRHDDLARSAYSSTIRAGRFLTMEQYLDELLSPGNRYLRYRETIEAWEAAFERSHVSVALFPEGRNIVQQLARELLGWEAPQQVTSSYFLNRGYGASTLEALRMINTEIAQDRRYCEDRPWAHTLIGHARGVLARSLERAARDCKSDRPRLGADGLSRLRSIVDADRDWLAATHGVSLPDLNEDAPAEMAEAERLEESAKSLLAAVSWRDSIWLRPARGLNF